VDLGVSGPLDAPHARGSVHVREGSLRLRAIPRRSRGSRALSSSTHARHGDGHGQMGGGTVELGASRVSGTGVHDVQLLFTGRDVALHYPGPAFPA